MSESNDTFRHWRPPLRRAVMRTRPEFFAWPIERQERYGVAMPEEDRARFEAALFTELFGRAHAARDALSPDEQNLWNETVLPLQGIGEDRFFLNEGFADDKTLLDFETVRDFDEDDYRFQEAARKNDDPGYSGKPYRGSLYLNWARLFVDGRFVYATLSMAAGYLYAKLESTASDLIGERIPHRYLPGRNHGKIEGESLQWDMRVDANGEEGILDELKRRVWHYDFARWDALLTTYDREDICGMYLLDESEQPETNLHFVFTDKRALSAVRFRSFMRDCRVIERPSGELERALETERAALARFIEDQHAEIRRTFDPKVIRLMKRRKILMAKDAFD